MENCAIPHSSINPHLDHYQFIDPVEDISTPEYKIQGNLYDEYEVIEDEKISFNPILTKDYNETNLYHQLGCNDPILEQKVTRAKAKYEELEKYIPGLDSTKAQNKLALFSKYLLDDEKLDRIIPDEPENIINLVPNKVNGAPDTNPLVSKIGNLFWRMSG